MATGTLHMPARPLAWRYAKKAAKRIIPLGVGLYFIPKIVAICFCVGLIDVLRNRPFRISTLDRYFFGNGIFTWLLSPVNLLLDVLSLPYINKGIYQLSDLPAGYRGEIESIIDTAHRRDIVGQLEKKMEGKPRGMMFFKWYGKNLDTSVDIPEYHEPFRYVRTIGVSVFSKKQSTGKHYGPLRMTLRVLYNVNTIDDRNVYIQVGDQGPLLARREAVYLRRHAAAPIVQRVGQGALLHVRRHPAAQLVPTLVFRHGGLQPSVDRAFPRGVLQALDVLEIIERPTLPLPPRPPGAPAVSSSDANGSRGSFFA